MNYREVLEAWKDAKKNANDAKKAYVNASVKLYATNATEKVLENKDFIFVSQIKSITKNDLKKMPAILETTKDELIHELKKKALAANVKAVADIKFEIHALFEGVFNVVLYGTSLS